MKVLYCRIGWMNSYHGNSNEKPQGGGKYNENNIGHEVYNYLGFEGKYYGFVEASVNNCIHIERLCGDKSADKVEHVLVVWVSKKPSGGQYIVGWYDNATVFRFLQDVPNKAMESRKLIDHNKYNVYSERVFLIDPNNRNYRVDGMGRSNVWYGNSEKNPETNDKVIEYINNFEKNYTQRIDSVESNISNIVGREKEAIVKIRVNQDKFRDGLISKYKGHCCLCGVNHKALLVASHIKPWAKSDNHEKLDLENGLLLCPNHDKLFDSGLISFGTDGKIMISSELSETNRIFMNINEQMKIEITENNAYYFKYHRDNIYIAK